MHVSGGSRFKFSLADSESAFEPLLSGLVKSGLGTMERQDQETVRVSREGDWMRFVNLEKNSKLFLLLFF
jgi:hypothetical protein